MVKRWLHHLVEDPPSSLAEQTTVQGEEETAEQMGRGRPKVASPTTGGSRDNVKGPLPPIGPENPHASTSSGRSDPNRPLEIARGQNGVASQTSPRGFGSRVGGGVQSFVDGTNGRGGASSFSSDNTVSSSVSRIRDSSQYPPSSQQPRGQQLQGPMRPSMSPPPVQMELGSHNQEKDYGDFRVELEEEDVVDLPNPEDQDFYLLLENLFHLQSREQLVHLSEHPIPLLETTW